MKIHISQDGRIYINGEYKGFTDDETVYIIENNRSRPIGTYEHRSEITTLVSEWHKGAR